MATQTTLETISQNRLISIRAQAEPSADSSQKGSKLRKVPDRYFIMKSLTVEDMELSVRNNIWATQAHNEETLNKAYEVRKQICPILPFN